MFKDSFVTRYDAWTVTEESDALPAVAFPAFVGTGKLGIGLDAGGLQGLTESLGEHYNCPVKPFHVTQADLYVLREGMISAHLWDDEIALTGARPAAEHGRREAMRNFMPLGFLDQSLEYDGVRMGPGDLQERPERYTLDGSAVRRHARFWRRDTDLRTGVVRTRYEIGNYNRFPLEVEVFAPFGSESVYVKLTRGARKGGSPGTCRWTVRLPLRTRHGLNLFDRTGAVQPGVRTLLARIDAASAHTPVEPYAVVYGVAADGLEVSLSPGGWTATLDGPLDQAQTAWLRLEFRRHAGADTALAAATQAALERELAGFSRIGWDEARAAHEAEFAAFWARTADVEVLPATEVETRRRFMLHMTEYLLRCGNEHALGGTVQFLLMHQNGWRACNFHDHHYIIDGLARANLWQEAEDHVRWMHRVMHPGGRPFPWMMTYDGFAPVPAEVDRAPMSDANRALLAMRIYELAGAGREALLRDHVYPILKAVAEHGVRSWFYEEGGRMLFRAVENDVMHDIPRVSESGTVMMVVTVLRKAAEYAERLGVDAESRAAWRRVAGAVRFDTTADGRYRAWFNAPDDAGGNDFFLNALYIAEAQEFADADTFRRSRDFGQRVASCNLAWLNSSAASCEIRLGRPDRGEQFMEDTLAHTIHGPGYFEECVPNGISSLPPFGTAHGAFLTACCEQVVLPDFWRPRVAVGVGLPARMRAARVRFANLRGPGGVLISGESDPRWLDVRLDSVSRPAALEVALSVPCALGVRFRVLRDGRPVAHRFEGEQVVVMVELTEGVTTVLRIEDAGVNP